MNKDELTLNSPKTAIARSKISAPLRHILNIKPELKRVFHQGPGRPDNPDREKVKEVALDSVLEYDPGHGPTDRNPLRKKDCDQAISIYVLNVLPPTTRKSAVIDIAKTLAPGGIAYVAVRSEVDISSSRNESWEKCRDGYAISRGKKRNFQKGYTPLSLKSELKDHFKIVETFDRGGFILAMARRGGRK